VFVEKNSGTTLRSSGVRTDMASSLPQLCDCPDELEATEPIFAIMPNVVEEDKRTVRSAREHRMIKVKGLDDCVNVIRPQPGVVVAVSRLARKAMTSHIQSDQSMVIRQARVHLATPLGPTL
jgi:hypothetical protein